MTKRGGKAALEVLLRLRIFSCACFLLCLFVTSSLRNLTSLSIGNSLYIWKLTGLGIFFFSRLCDWLGSVSHLRKDRVLSSHFPCVSFAAISIRYVTLGEKRHHQAIAWNEQNEPCSRFMLKCCLNIWGELWRVLCSYVWRNVKETLQFCNQPLFKQRLRCSFFLFEGTVFSTFQTMAVLFHQF